MRQDVVPMSIIADSVCGVIIQRDTRREVSVYVCNSAVLACVFSSDGRSVDGSSGAGDTERDR